MRTPNDDRGRFSLKDLAIAAAASAGAALVVPLFWRQGTIFAAVMTPVIFSIMHELLARPATTVGDVRRRIRGPSPTSAARRLPTHPGRVNDDDDFDPVQPGGFDPRRVRRVGHDDFAPPERPFRERGEDRFGLYGEKRRRGRRGRAIRSGLIVGLIAALITIATITFTEVAVLGKSVLPRASAETTFFGGGKAKDGVPEPSPNEEATPAPRGSERAAPTATQTPSATATPAPTASPIPAVTPTVTPPPAPLPQQTPQPQSPTVTPAPTPRGPS